MRILSLTVIFLVMAKTSGQNIIWEKTINPYVNKVSDIFHLQNKTSKDFIFCFADKSNVFTYLTDDSFKSKDSIFLTNRKLGSFLGGRTIQNEYQLFFLQKKELQVNTFDFNSRKFNSQTINLSSQKGYVFLTSFVNHNQVYLLYISRKNNKLALYSLDNDLNPVLKELDFSNRSFRNWDGEVSSLFNVIKFPTPVNNRSDQDRISSAIRKIDYTSYAQLNKTNVLSKAYVKGNEVIITLDANSNFTQILTFNLTTGETQVKGFPKPILQAKAEDKKSNSYLFNNHLFSISVSDKEFKLDIRHYPTKELKKSYSYSLQDSFEIKNTPYILEDAALTDYKELESLTRFLRRINNKYLGITVNLEKKNNYEITIGSAFPVGQSIQYSLSPIQNVAIPIPISGGGAKTHIKCALDQEFDNITHDIEPGFLQNVAEFPFKNNGLKNQLNREDFSHNYDYFKLNPIAFILDGDVYRGYYLFDDKKFLLLKFKK